jgi:molybdopterin-guanine dinucleotide biosynthesis protein A
MADRQLTGVLLVGGASRRFGSAKALARYRGTTLAEHAWGVLGEACDERLAFGKTGDQLPLPFPVHDDGSDVRAPIAGVVAGLRAGALALRDALQELEAVRVAVDGDLLVNVNAPEELAAL